MAKYDTGITVHDQEVASAFAKVKAATEDNWIEVCRDALNSAYTALRKAQHEKYMQAKQAQNLKPGPAGVPSSSSQLLAAAKPTAQK